MVKGRVSYDTLSLKESHVVITFVSESLPGSTSPGKGVSHPPLGEVDTKGTTWIIPHGSLPESPCCG